MRKHRVSTVDFRQKAVRRMQAEESSSALAREPQMRRKPLYERRTAWP